MVAVAVARAAGGGVGVGGVGGGTSGSPVTIRSASLSSLRRVVELRRYPRRLVGASPSELLIECARVRLRPATSSVVILRNVTLRSLSSWTCMRMCTGGLGGDGADRSGSAGCLCSSSTAARLLRDLERCGADVAAAAAAAPNAAPAAAATAAVPAPPLEEPSVSLLNRDLSRALSRVGEPESPSEYRTPCGSAGMGGILMRSSRSCRDTFVDVRAVLV